MTHTRFAPFFFVEIKSLAVKNFFHPVKFGDAPRLCRTAAAAVGQVAVCYFRKFSAYPAFKIFFCRHQQSQRPAAAFFAAKPVKCFTVCRSSFQDARI